MAADYQATMDALTRGSPRDVSDFIVRRVDCNHWAGEEAIDDERRQEIQDAMDRLNCQAIDEDERSLRHSYANNPKVLRALDEARNVVF